MLLFVVLGVRKDGGRLMENDREIWWFNQMWEGVDLLL